jgi:predicted O-linked N-acetylglucosamine transferase (SPINDLY family)
MGVEYYDYILADPHIIPPDHQKYYSERVAYLPDTYMPTDASLKVSNQTPTRAQCGLPNVGFVFCSFSHDYKISPHVFDIWMRLLVKIPGSVLWLMSRNELSQRNLRLQAEKRGVAGNRLIFAERVPLVEDHLARYRQADLFLDTHPYNAHTTTADALMAGLPVLTYSGDSFPSRVAGGLLKAVGVPELVTYSHKEYEALALRLAQDPELLAHFKTQIAANKSTSSLFNTKQFCFNLETVLSAMWRVQQLGEVRDEIGTI